MAESPITQPEEKPRRYVVNLISDTAFSRHYYSKHVWAYTAFEALAQRAHEGGNAGRAEPYREEKHGPWEGG